MNSEKRIPSRSGLVLLIITIFIGVVVTSQKTSLNTKASGNCSPLNPQITNITYNSAVISFTTSAECLSTVNVDGQVFVESKEKGKVHYFEITPLKESKAYSFVIISGGENYSYDSFNFKTAQKPAKEIPNSNLAWGRVFTPDNNPATNAIVYFNITSASPLSALVTSSGNWSLALATSFNESLTDWFTPSSNMEENITVIAPDFDQTQVINSVSHNNPVPDIILGQNNFSSPFDIEEDSNNNSFLDMDYSLNTDQPLDISNPKNNENIPNKRPDFFGTASPNSKIRVKIESPVTINSEVNVDGDGSWNWSPSQDLTPGEHTITITDEKNQTVSRKFIVLAAESQTSFTASASATTPTIAPTIILTPTIVPTNIPIPTKIPVVNPSTASGIPKTGISFPTVSLIFMSLIFVIFAFVYYKKI